MATWHENSQCGWAKMGLTHCRILEFDGGYIVISYKILQHCSVYRDLQHLTTTVARWISQTADSFILLIETAQLAYFSHECGSERLR